MTFTYPDPSSGFTAVNPTSVGGKIVQFPLVRLIIALAFLVPANFLHRLIESGLRENLSSGYESTITIVDAVTGIILLLISYHLYSVLIERRKPAELGRARFCREFMNGLGLAAGLVGLATATALLFSDYSIFRTEISWFGLVSQFFYFSAPALIEEIIFRLILFRITEEWLGSWPAVIIQAVLFGFAHGGNPGATIWSSVSIVLSAGALLSAVYMYTRRIWMVWGLHIFWNYFQSAVMGLPVSGRHGEGVLSTTLVGPEWITGGEFGIEASALTVLIVLIVGIFFFNIVIKNNRLVLPSWKRKPPLPPNPPQSEILSSSE